MDQRMGTSMPMRMGLGGLTASASRGGGVSDTGGGHGRPRRSKFQHPSSEIHEQIEIDRQHFFREPGKVKLFRDYADGLHARILTLEQTQILEGVLDNQFCDNVCHLIVSENSDRVDLVRFECPDDSQVEDFLNQFFLRTGLADNSGEVHYEALRDGNVGLALDWDEEAEFVSIVREPWWDGNIGVFIAYDANNKPLYAVKEWDTFQGRRRNVWFEDRLERYISEGGLNWAPYPLPEDMGQWPIGWTKSGGDDLHIPIIHFANSGRGFQNYGKSELDGGVIGFQDQINDLQFAIEAAARQTGYQMTWSKGFPLAVGEDGQPVRPEIGPGQWFHSESTDAEWGTLPAGSIEELIGAHMMKLKSVARMTKTPLHTITGGDWPSGEALIRAEMPLINKAYRQIKKFTRAWAMVAHRATELANVFGGMSLNEDAIIIPVFEAPDKRDQLTRSTIVHNIENIISQEEALRIMGRSPDQIERIMSETPITAVYKSDTGAGSGAGSGDGPSPNQRRGNVGKGRGPNGGRPPRSGSDITGA